jgi:hypothetical protein
MPRCQAAMEVVKEQLDFEEALAASAGDIEKDTPQR